MNNQGTFSHHQTIIESTHNVTIVDLTGDGKMLLEVNLDANIKIYKNLNNTFTILQTLTPSDGASQTKAGAITDDHEWIAFGTWNSAKVVDIHKFDGQKYTINQTIQISTSVRSIAMTQDHSFLAVGTRG